MTTVNSTSSNTGTTGTTGTSGTSSSTDATENRFLKLLTAQLKNQDPLNPMDNSQMTMQLAQLDTVSGIERLNTTLSSLVESLGSSQSMQAATLIGKNVLVPGNNLTLSSGVAYGGINLAKAADKVVVHILDAKGNEVQTENLGSADAGVLDFVWDGKNADGTQLADGAYTFKVEATQGGNSLSVDALQVGMVSAVVKSGNGFLLDLGKLGTFDYSKVMQVL